MNPHISRSGQPIADDVLRQIAAQLGLRDLGGEGSGWYAENPTNPHVPGAQAAASDDAVKMYHGTVDSRVQSILKEGISTKYAGEVYSEWSKRDHVYVTSTMESAIEWANDALIEHYGKVGKNPPPHIAIFEVRIPKSEVGRLRADSNLMIGFKEEETTSEREFDGSIPPEWITHAYVSDIPGAIYKPERLTRILVAAEDDVQVFWVAMIFAVPEELKTAGGSGSGWYADNSENPHVPGAYGKSLVNLSPYQLQKQLDYVRGRMQQSIGNRRASIEFSPNGIAAARQVADVLDEMHRQGYQMPSEVVVESIGFDQLGGMSERGNLQVHFPKEMPSGSDINEAIHKAFKDGSTSQVLSLHDLVAHEMAHVQVAIARGTSIVRSFADIEGQARMTGAEAMKIAGKVSQYATKNADEFIAETFMRLYRGDRLSPDVTQLYQSIDGPNIRASRTAAAPDWKRVQNAADARIEDVKALMLRAFQRSQKSITLAMLRQMIETKDVDKLATIIRTEYQQVLAKRLPVLLTDLAKDGAQIAVQKIPELKAAGGAGSGWYADNPENPHVPGAQANSVARAQANSVDRAKEALSHALRSDQIRIDNHPLTVKAAHEAAKILTEMRVNGYAMPASLTVEISYGPAGLTTNGSHLTLDLPFTAPDDATPDSVVRAAFLNSDGTRKTAVNTFREVVIHEMAHVQNWPNISKFDQRDPYWNRAVNLGKGNPSERGQIRDDIYNIAESVSSYATNSPDEFLAEAFVRMYRGEHLSDNAMWLYSVYGGVPVPRPKARTAGGAGSGNFGHAGRPGEVGGSAPSNGGVQPPLPPVTTVSALSSSTPESIQKMHEKDLQVVTSDTDTMDVLANANIHYALTDGSVATVKPEVAGVRPRGWVSGTWDDVQSGFDITTKTIILGNPDLRGESYGSVAAHETGHALHHAMERTRASWLQTRLWSAWNDSVKDNKMVDPYFRQGGIAGVQESFAESYSILRHHGKESVKDNFGWKWRDAFMDAMNDVHQTAAKLRLPSVPAGSQS